MMNAHLDRTCRLDLDDSFEGYDWPVKHPKK